MRLDEIIQTFIAKKQAKKELGQRAQYDRYGPTNQLGSGHFSWVSTTKDPALVAKTSNVTSRLVNDANYIYLKYIVDNNLAAENPYFPRIYSIVLVDSQAKPGFYHTNIKMEKLLGFNDIETELLRAEARKIFNITAETYGEQAVKYFDKGMKVEIAAIYNQGLRAYLVNDDTAVIQDPKLTEALDVIKRVQESYPIFSYDLHVGNFMFRRISTGIQLVLTDPIA